MQLQRSCCNTLPWFISVSLGPLKTIAVIVILTLVVAAYWVFRSRSIRQSAYGVRYRGGDCTVWYSRRGTTVSDVLIAPRLKLQEVFRAGPRLLATSDGVVSFGATGKAYILDGARWVIVPIQPFDEREMPLGVCNDRDTILEVAECVLKRPIPK